MAKGVAGGSEERGGGSPDVGLVSAKVRECWKDAFADWVLHWAGLLGWRDREACCGSAANHERCPIFDWMDAYIPRFRLWKTHRRLHCSHSFSGRRVLPVEFRREKHRLAATSLTRTPQSTVAYT